MGLDMYLYRNHYVQNWDHNPENEKWSITVKRGGKAVPQIKSERISYIKESIGYWRKANAIHLWFVNNCAEGVDDCRPVYVSKDSLQALLEEVETVLRSGTLGGAGVDPEVAAEHLPATDGFFFGSTEYDEWYVQDLHETKRIITDALAELGDDDWADFEYLASW